MTLRTEFLSEFSDATSHEELANLYNEELRRFQSALDSAFREASRRLEERNRRLYAERYGDPSEAAKESSQEDRVNELLGDLLIAAANLQISGAVRDPETAVRKVSEQNPAWTPFVDDALLIASDAKAWGKVRETAKKRSKDTMARVRKALK